MPGPFLLILLFVALVAYVGAQHVGSRAHGRRVLPGYAVLGLSALLAAWVGMRVALDTHPIASGELTVGSAGLVVPASSGPVSVVVRGHLPEVEPEASAAASFTLAVADHDGNVGTYPRRLEEHWDRRKVGRGRGSYQALAVHDEERIDVTRPAEGAERIVTVREMSGDLVGPLAVEVVPAPPALRLVGLLAGLAAVGGTVADGCTQGRTVVAGATAILGTFAMALLSNITPHGPVTAVAGAAMIAVLCGAMAAGMLRLVVAALGPESWR